MSSADRQGLVHKYAGWPGKSACGAEGEITSIKSADVTCDNCKAQGAAPEATSPGGEPAPRKMQCKECGMHYERSQTSDGWSSEDEAENADLRRHLKVTCQQLRAWMEDCTCDSAGPEDWRILAEAERVLADPGAGTKEGR